MARGSLSRGSGFRVAAGKIEKCCKMLGICSPCKKLIHPQAAAKARK